MVRALIERVAGYPGLFLFCAISGIALPIPEDLSLVYAGIRIRGGEWSWLPVIAVAISGVFVRDVLAFGIGRTVGDYVFANDWTLRLLGKQRLERARGLVDRHEALAVLLGRFFVGMRAPIFFVAGAMGVSRRKFVAYDALGLVVAVPAMIGIGYLFGEPVVDLLASFFKRTREATVVVIALGLVWVVWRISGLVGEKR